MAPTTAPRNDPSGAQREPSPRDARPPRILVVDDDPEMRELITLLLSSNGYVVHEAISGSDLLRVASSIRADKWPLDGVDLIVVDNRMPGITGIEAIRRLRAERWDVPVILITAFPEPDVTAQARTLRARVLPKPFSLDALADEVLLSLV
jgi:two-component system, OmpR family, response regulator